MNTCPVCNGSSVSRYRYDSHSGCIGKRLHVRHSIASALSPLLRLCHHRYCDSVRMELLFSPIFYLVRCNNCGHGVYDRHIETELLEKYYNTIYWQSEGLPSSTWHQQRLYMEDSRANGQYRCVREWVQQLADLNVLEIGAAKAFFSRLLKEEHHGTAHLNVVEPGSGWEPYYRSIGISLVARYFPFESHRQFHYVHTSHWFEHVSDVNSALSKIKELLAPNGLLFIEVPNCNDEYYSVDRADRPHIHFFTAKSLCTLLENKGFRTLTVDEYGLTWREEQVRKDDPDAFDRDFLHVGNRSIKENIPRKGGDCLRALFQLSE